MFPPTPPTANLSRYRLKALSKWVRDELDIRVAREGPNILRPDDVLILHETFVALRYAIDITALDLRATGIHRAVQDIAGVATRWPGRLCDDCDKIISIWTARFGPLNELHPFLYGRGGRLEGVATVTQYSREAILKRWSEYCPEKLHPKRSHKLGDLGFRAGDWWINTLFAHHAGIIGLEAIEGGSTFDKHGAYALVLKDTGEAEAYDGNSFTYRVPQWDKGRFRLTAATPRSRDPIRVLRSHSINSMWGPKAGVRYEGLYGVKGWSIRQAKSADVAGGQWKEGDILFDVRFERNDPMPFSEVVHRPTATEFDDYTEYKRLRKLHREGKRNAGLTIDLSNVGPQPPVKAAPPIAPAVAPWLIGPSLTVAAGAAALKIARKGSSRKKKHLHFELPDDRRSLKLKNPIQTPKVQSPPTSPASFKANDTDYFFSTPSPARKASNLAVPAASGYSQPKKPSPPKVNVDLEKGKSPATSSDLTAASTQKNIREVAPWIDLEAELHLPEEDEAPLSRQISLKISPTVSSKMHKGKQRPEKESPPMSPWSSRRKSGGMGRTFLLTPGGRKGDQDPGSRKSIFVRSKNPMAKHLDGAGENVNDDEEPVSPKSRPRRQASSSESIGVISPIPIRPHPISPESPFALGRRGAIYTDGLDDDDEISPIDTHAAEFPNDNDNDENGFAPLPTNDPRDNFSPSPTHTVNLPSTNTYSFNFSPVNHPTAALADNDDPFIDVAQSPFPTSLISRVTTSVATHTHVEMSEAVSTAKERTKEDARVVFNFPSWATPTTKEKEKRDSLDVAPDEA